MSEMQAERLERLQELVNSTIGVEQSIPLSVEGFSTPPIEDADLASKKTQLRIEYVIFASQKPLKQRAAPYFARAEKFFRSAECAMKDEKDNIAARRLELANKFYARGFRNLYSELLAEEDYLALRRITRHYAASLELCDKAQHAVDELRRFGRFLVNKNRWWEANAVLEEAVELIDAYKLPTGGKERQYLNLTELMTREATLTRSQLIEFAKKEGMLKGIAYVKNVDC